MIMSVHYPIPVTSPTTKKIKTIFFNNYPRNRTAICKPNRMICVRIFFSLFLFYFHFILSLLFFILLQTTERCCKNLSDEMRMSVGNLDGNEAVLTSGQGWRRLRCASPPIPLSPSPSTSCASHSPLVLLLTLFTLVRSCLVLVSYLLVFSRFLFF